MIEYIGGVLWWWFMSIVKFLLAPSLMFGTGDWTFLEVFLISGSGATIGVFIFYTMGEKIFNFIDSRRKKTPKKFTRLTRLIARVKAKYGLRGILVICALVSVPISSLLAARYYRSAVTMPLLILSFWIWAAILTSISFAVKMLFQ